MVFPWSRVQDTPLASIARELISYNKCEYHNWDHVVSMYQYLADTYSRMIAVAAYGFDLAAMAESAAQAADRVIDLLVETEAKDVELD